MQLKPQPLPFDPSQFDGLSEKLLQSHHQNNYGGAVKRLNSIRGELATLPFGSAAGFALNGLKREELIAANSALWHELYFDSLSPAAQDMAPAMALALAASFGSVDRWREEFIAMGRALGGGSGWVLLSFLPREGRLVNHWAADHTHALAGGLPLLALDMYEHAYHMDHGANAAAYVDAFMKHIAWDKVYLRYQHAVHASSEDLAADRARVGQTVLLDVRRAGPFEQANSMLPGAQWRDPSKVDEWAAELPTDSEVIVYCIYGHEVGRSTAMRLRASGLNARYLAGGIDAWERDGLPLQSKDGVS